MPSNSINTTKLNNSKNSPAPPSPPSTARRPSDARAVGSQARQAARPKRRATADHTTRCPTTKSQPIVTRKRPSSPDMSLARSTHHTPPTYSPKPFTLFPSAQLPQPRVPGRARRRAGKPGLQIERCGIEGRTVQTLPQRMADLGQHLLLDMG